MEGIEALAIFDRATQKFILDLPTLISRKRWPAGLGKTQTHAIVHARLTLAEKDVGVQAFLVQVRSMLDHTPLAGIEVGDMGLKLVFNAVENGDSASVVNTFDTLCRGGAW